MSGPALLGELALASSCVGDGEVKLVQIVILYLQHYHLLHWKLVQSSSTVVPAVSCSPQPGANKIISC